jgi:hypothetical protein
MALHWKNPSLRVGTPVEDNFCLPPEFLRYPHVSGRASAELAGLAKGDRGVPGMLQFSGVAGNSTELHRI